MPQSAKGLEQQGRKKYIKGEYLVRAFNLPQQRFLFTVFMHAIWHVTVRCRRIPI